MRSRLIFAAIAASASLVLAQQQQQAPAAAKRPPTRPMPPADDMTGFEPIFDGKSLEGWDGDPVFWRVQDGVLTGESTAEKVLKGNTFIIWRGGTTRDFELKLELRITEVGNSGIQYRSTPLPDVGKFVLKGYQADVDGRDMYTGMLYEERGRGFLAPRGQFSRMSAEGKLKLIGTPGTSDELKSALKPGDWNSFHIIARGNTIFHVVNGRVMAVFIDEDPKGRSEEGLLGLQLHQGPPMKVEFRNIMLRKL